MFVGAKLPSPSLKNTATLGKPARPCNVHPQEPGGDVTVHAYLVHSALNPTVANRPRRSAAR